jgi:hypothetical protein
MRTLFLPVILFGLFLLPEPAAATFMTGNELLRVCTTDMLSLQCTGYFEAAVDLQGLERTRAGLGECIPATTEAGQIKDAVVNFLQQNPALRDDNAAALVELAVARNWGCPSR